MMISVLPPPMSQTRRRPGPGRHRVRDAGIDEARFFDAGNDFDRMADGFARALDEGLLAPCAPEGVGADHANAVGPHVAQALAEPLQAGQRARGDILVQASIRLQARAETHHFAQPIEDDQLAVRVTRDHHVEAVGTEIDGGEYVGDGLRSASRHVSERRQAENEDPQPQVVCAFGLRITNCAPSSPSR